MSYYLDWQCETCLKREGENLGRNIVIHSIILNGMPENVVTHADYRALEEELAALRGRVVELVEADIEFDRNEDGEVKTRDEYEHGIIRRRLALEAFK